ncbi:hypothetical protein IQ279_09880 [Streptomyces verrucosisporus]|nr:hypothetical protein [Streptomyces verrucosisporus]
MTRLLPQVNRVSGISIGLISMAPFLDSRVASLIWAVVGCTSISSVASCGWIPSGAASSSWSVASISAVNFHVSCAGPFSRSASLRSPPLPPPPASPLPPAACGLMLRSRVSGLNCSTMMRCGIPRSGSTITIPDRMGLGMSA